MWKSCKSWRDNGARALPCCQNAKHWWSQTKCSEAMLVPFLRIVQICDDFWRILDSFGESCRRCEVKDFFPGREAHVLMWGSHVGAIWKFFTEFWRFLGVCGQFWRVMWAFTDLWSILKVFGRFWASFGRPCWSQFGGQDGWKWEKHRFWYHFGEHLRGKQFRRRFWDHFRGAWRGKNEQKCGTVCSDSLFSVRNIRSISDAFSIGFWEGLGSILGGFSVPRTKKWRSRALWKGWRKRKR